MAAGVGAALVAACAFFALHDVGPEHAADQRAVVRALSWSAAAVLAVAGTLALGARRRGGRDAVAAARGGDATSRGSSPSP